MSDKKELVTTRVKLWKFVGHTVEVRKTDGVGTFYYLGYIDGKKSFAIEYCSLSIDPKITMRKGILNFDGHAGGFIIPCFTEGEAVSEIGLHEVYPMLEKARDEAGKDRQYRASPTYWQGKEAGLQQALKIVEGYLMASNAKLTPKKLKEKQFKEFAKKVLA